jgi:hypothetical protein
MSDLSKILESVKESNAAANKERLISPELIQKTRALRASAGEIHHAFCKTNASASTEIDCYLDEDKTEENNPEEITVHCNISGGGDKYLNNSIRNLVDGDRLEVVKIDKEWIALEGFQTRKSCVCTPPS